MTPPDPGAGQVRWLAESTDLADLGVDPGEIVGGKAAGLARLVAAGLPVPAGFVAWDAVGARVGYAVLAHRCDVADPLVAVRSSSPVEDGSTRSAAGVLPTELGVRGAADVAKSVERIVAAEAALGRTREDRTRDNRTRGHVPGRYPVLVQVLVAARSAGVSFSAHPVTGSRDRVVIEAVHGLGVLLTDGQVVPDHVVVHRHTGAVLTARAGRQRRIATVNESGVTQVAHSEQPRGEVPGQASGQAPARVLSAGQVDLVVDLTLRAEAAIGAAADVEWAFDEVGRLWVLQARPITTLPAVPLAPPGCGSGRAPIPQSLG